MHTTYQASAEQIKRWAEQDPNIQGVVLIGSQVRESMPGDEWSDLDVLVFAQDAASYTGDLSWLCQFGNVVSTCKEVVDLSFVDLQWHVNRAMYDDHRMIDFSIIPVAKLDVALEINAEIHARGFLVLYDADGGKLSEKIRASLVGFQDSPPPAPDQEELDSILDDLLFHEIWIAKKLMRNELWTAVRCINRYMNDLLLRLVEAHNTIVTKRSSALQYDGRLLETRADPPLLEGLRNCYSKYDRQDAWCTLDHMIGLIRTVSQQIRAAQGLPPDIKKITLVKSMLDDIRSRSLE